MMWGIWCLLKRGCYLNWVYKHDNLCASSDEDQVHGVRYLVGSRGRGAVWIECTSMICMVKWTLYTSNDEDQVPDAIYLVECTSMICMIKLLHMDI